MILEGERYVMPTMSDIVRLTSGYAKCVELKSDFEATQETADRMARYPPR